jgi:hypothetical protein
MFRFVIAISREVFDSHKIYRSILFAAYSGVFTQDQFYQTFPLVLFGQGMDFWRNSGFGACLNELGLLVGLRISPN